MKAGFFETDITPPYGIERSGDYNKKLIKSVLTPLKVRAAVFDNGKSKAVFAGIDTCMIDSAACNAACEIVKKVCDISRENIMIGGSHTHSGGAVNSLFDFSLSKEDLPPDIYDLVANKSTQPDPHFRDIVIKQLASAIIWAYENTEEVLINFGKGYESRYIFNRRFRLKDGRSCTHPGAMNPSIVCPAGPIDPDVGVLGAWRKDGSLLGCVVNYACHGTVIPGTMASADWIYYMQKTVKKVMGKKAVTVFLNGASGDVTQIDNLSYDVSFGSELAFKMGTRIGAEVVKILNEREPRQYNTIDIQWETLKISRRPLSAETISRNREILKTNIPEADPQWIFAKEKVIYNYIYSQNPIVDVPCQAIQVGNALFISNPSEFFCQFGLDIKKASNFKYTFVVSLANGCAGYVPTPESFDASGGGYETLITSYSNLEIKAGKKITDACIRLSKNVKHETIADPYANQEPVTNIWSYGNFPPELE